MLSENINATRRPYTDILCESCQLQIILDKKMLDPASVYPNKEAVDIEHNEYNKGVVEGGLFAWDYLLKTIDNPAVLKAPIEIMLAEHYHQSQMENSMIDSDSFTYHAGYVAGRTNAYKAALKAIDRTDLIDLVDQNKFKLRQRPDGNYELDTGMPMTNVKYTGPER